ncbi:DUF2160 domain-containing protein [Pseudobacteriovorax antillogorgiicola]|uniref:Predicted small integral membrane protein n=1 Tax=Pseudobacteriovorax antillogorgiicola TaxID=1513793 RepID=A0A1Y6CKM6_9BACT|nr:DUF2160 family membrane protein [Pseudobacteriovorax antillogorgiicola]TCS47630.1 putative small integral membrane protein [Pseudobacteriovorax antillogorgiicola]SMF59976.1 Predicted small integral membrane protein [Pseudobacteriovorax antillogorgiicola]
MLNWMAWTTPTALFFLSIALGIGAMCLWQFKEPTVIRQGVLPFPTTRGDRFFIALLSAAFFHIFAILAFRDPSWGTLISLLAIYPIFRWA